MCDRPTVELLPAGQDAVAVPGDLLFVRRRGLIQVVIRLGQALRPSLHPWAGYTHVSCVADAYGGLIQAELKGVRKATLADYTGVEYVLVHTHMMFPDDQQGVQFLNRQLGDRYGILTFIATGLRMLTPGRGMWLGMNGSEFCSGLAARMLERGWHDFGDVLPASMCPAELARALGVPHAR